MGLHPIFIVLAVATVLVSFFKIYQLIPWSMPLTFGISLAVLTARFYYLDKERRRKTGAAVDVDFDRLRATEVKSRLPAIMQSIRGHDEALSRIVEKVQKNLRVSSPKTTLGAFFLVGPTGTGKTYLGEVLAQALYPDSEPLILRMNQYKHPEDVYTLIGPPAGQPGYEVGGTLTRPLLENPYRVIVLDEIDKCHPDIRHCLYDILDTASCREKSSGRTVHFGASVILATCNAGVETLRGIWAESSDPVVRTGRAREALSRENFEKPFLARFSDIFLLDQLPSLVIAEVACLQLAKHWRQHGIEVSYADPEVLVQALQRNMEFEEYGVRQLSHLIQDMTADSIESAKRQGARRVRLLTGGSGGIAVEALP